MTGIRIGAINYPTIADALRAAVAGDLILVGAGTFSAPLLLAASPTTTLKGSGSNGQSILVNTPILDRSGQGKFAPNFTIQNLAFDYGGQSGYLFAPSIGSVPYNPVNPTLISFTLRDVAFTGRHLGNAGVSGTYMDISGAKNTVFDGIRVSLMGQASYDPLKGTGGGFFIFHEGGADIQILNSEFNELGYSSAIILLYINDARVQGNRFLGGGMIKQDDVNDPEDNPRGERFVNAGGLFANNHLSNGAFFDYLLQINSDTGTVWTDYKRNFATADGTFGLRTNVTGNTFDILPSGFGLLIRADISPQTVEKMLSITGNAFNHGLPIRSDLTSPYDLAFGANFVNGIRFDYLRVGGTSGDQLNLDRANGNNWISGGIGNDFLHSSNNRFDAFVFYSPLNAEINLDTIVGFETSGNEADEIWLDGEIFAGLIRNADQLDPKSFSSNTSGSGSENRSQIVYNTSTGELLYDADGFGLQKGIAFAILSGKESISAQNFRFFNTPSSPLPPSAFITLAVAPTSVAEDGPTNLTYTFTRTGATTSALTVNYSVGGTATLGADYTGIAGTPAMITFAAGSAIATVTVDPTTDSSVEPDETVALSLAAGTGYTIGTSAAVVGTIANDDVPPPPVITLAVSPASEPEDGSTNLIYTFSRTGSTTSPLTVNYTAGGTATLGSDYTGIPATPVTKTITFAAGSATTTVTVDPTTDSSVEPDETVALTLAAGTGYTIGTAAAVVGTITNDDEPPPPPVITLAVAPTSVAEDGPTNLIYTFTRNGATTSALTLNYSVGGTATLGTDYTGIPVSPASKSITFSAGSATATVTVDPTTDSSVEPDETVVLSLAPGTGYTIGTPAAIIGTIANDDVAPTASALPRPTVISAVDLDSASSSPATQQAGNVFDNKTSTKYLNFGGINSGVSFTYSLPTLLSSFTITTANDLPARDPATYQLYGFQGGSWRLLTSGKLNLPSVRLRDSAPVSLPNLPSLTQYRLIFPTMKASGNFMQIADLKLFGKQSSPLPRPTTISAVDLDSASASPATHPVANAFDNKASSKYLNFGGINSGINFTYSLPTRFSSFVVTTANDLPGRDPAAYQLYGFSQGSWKLLTSGSLQLPIARLTDSAPISLPNLPSLSQYRLTFPRLKANGNVMQIAELKLFGSQSSSAAPSPAPLPAIFLAVSPASVSEDGPANLIYTFSRTGATTNALTVNYTAGGTATLGSDYTGIPATPVTKTITFAAGSATTTVTVDPTTDSSVEPDETVALTLAAGTGYTVGTTAAVIGTITNDDLFPPSPSSTSTIYSGSFATPNEVDSYSVNVAPGTIISASITTPSQQSLYPLINLFDASSSLLKGSLAYDRDFADLGMFDLITGNATLKVGTQTGFLGDYELKISFINREAVKNEVVSLTNAQRLQAGLNPLTRNQLLESAAQAHVADMDASNRYLAHTGSNGSDPVTRIAATGYKGGWVDLGNGQLRTISSENAAVGYMTPAEVVNAWMNSAGHRAAILDPYTKEIGIGFEFDNEVGDITDQSYKIGTTYWVQNFGYPWQTGMQVWF